MEAERKLKTAYHLFKKDRIYRDKTLSSLYFKSTKEQAEKKSQPIDIDGIRYKLDLETGEIANYKKSEVLNSMACSLRRSKICMNMLLEMNDFDWFATLTFDKERIDRTNDEAVYNAYKKYIDNTKQQFPNTRYLTVPERHEDGCIHFHMLLGGITTKQLGLVNSGKVCCSWAYTKNKVSSKEYFERTKHEHELTDTDGLPIYNVTTFPYGFTTVTRIVSRERCNSYVKKYINKDIGKSTEIFKKRFFYSRNLNVPTIVSRLIGADFETPMNIKEIMFNSPHLQNATSVQFSEQYNVLQFWEDNETKQIIDSGFIPLQLEPEEKKAIFKELETQLSFDELYN